jgi:hypothetical protein
MELLIVAAVIALICWVAAQSHRAGEKEAEARHEREITEARTPDWITYVGQISGVGECEPMPGLYSLHVIGQPMGYTSIALKRALAANFADGVGRGRTIIYTISSGGVLEGFTPIEEWTGPEIPSQGIEEKHITRLQPKHKNQFIDDYLRQQVEGDPKYENVRFW